MYFAYNSLSIWHYLYAGIINDDLLKEDSDNLPKLLLQEVSNNNLGFLQHSDHVIQPLQVHFNA